MSKILELLQRIETPNQNLFEAPVYQSNPESSPSFIEPIENEEPLEFEPKLIPIASGKGGVGKTNIAVSLSIALADRLKEKNSKDEVILVDCDFGLPNADIILGVKHRRTIDDFISKRIDSLSSAVSPTQYPGLNFLSGSSTPSMMLSHFQYQQRQKFLRNLRSLRSRFIVLDLGASVHLEVIDFFSMVNSGIVITNPEPTAMRDSFLFIRATLMRKLKKETSDMPVSTRLLDSLENGMLEIPSVPGLLNELKKSGELMEYKTLKAILNAFRPKLIVNRAEDFNEGLEVAKKMRDSARRELGIEITFLGPVLQDACVVKSVKEAAPFVKRYPDCDASHWVRNIAQRVEENTDFEIERNYFSFGSYLKRLFGKGSSSALNTAAAL